MHATQWRLEVTIVVSPDKSRQLGNDFNEFSSWLREPSTSLFSIRPPLTTNKAET